jgi:DNA-binding NarL/FixJ family response regulator
VVIETQAVSDIRVGVASQDPFFLFGVQALLGRDRHTRLLARGKSLAALGKTIEDRQRILDAILLDFDSVPDTSSVRGELHQLTELPSVPRVLCIVEGALSAMPADIGNYPLHALLSKRDIGYAVHLSIRSVVEYDTVLLTPRTAQRLSRSCYLRTNGDIIRQEHRHPELTERLYEVAKLRLVLGLDNQDIADELLLKPITVRGYVSRIYKRLGVEEPDVEEEDEETSRELEAFEELSNWWWVDRFPV